MSEGTMDKEHVWLAALAGLLHDIGKFAQGAGRPGDHAEVGAGWIECIRDLFPRDAWEDLVDAVAQHHSQSPHKRIAKVVRLADWLAAGERADEKQEQPKQLLSIFCRLETQGQDGKTQRAPGPLYWPLRPLALEQRTLFPQAECQEHAVVEGYKALWQGFQEQAEALRDAHRESDNLSVYLESLLLVMQRYTWCIPSAYYHSLPDVSLYDHSRMTAALAACLTGKPESVVEQILRAPEQSAEPVAVLVSGDISGVQNFIYTISAQGATPGLRGRSFYLQLLTEVVARYVLRHLGLPVTNLIYQGGGAFYLLARADDGDRLVEIQREISHVLLAHHRGDLYLALAHVPLVAADFYDGRISSKWEELTRALREVKQRRFVELGEEMRMLFEPQGHGGNQDKECQVCGQEHPETRELKKSQDDESGTRKCPQCESYEELGDKLRHARYLWLAERESHIPNSPLGETPGRWDQVLAALGYRCDVAEGVPRLPDSSYRVILTLKDEAFKGLRPDAQTAVGRRFLVNVTPVYEQVDADWLTRQSREARRRLAEDLPERPGVAVKPFSLLEMQSEGIERLGVLRMDVDNLGDIFASGLGDHATLSRIAALSFAISLYFEGWVGHIAEEMNADPNTEYRDTLYSIYSGGDDLFFVGAWDRVVELARRIRADLTPFAAHHPGIHTSAGLVLVSGKYPLAQAARDAGEAESRAKQRDGKDALNFLGQTTAWARFGLDDCAASNLETVHGMAHHLLDLVKAKDGPKALLRLLIRLQAQHDEADQKRRARGDEVNRAGQEQVLYGPWMWRGAYYLKRMAKRYEKTNPTTYDALESLREHLHTDRFRAIEWIGLAARWAELLGRESQ